METYEGVPAGFWIRVVAYLIDSFVLLPVVVLLMFIQFATMSPNLLVDDAAIGFDGDLFMKMLFANILCVMLAIVLSAAYFTLLESSKWQGTVGKKIMGIQVARQDGSRISVLQSLGRYIVKPLSGIFYVGFIMVGVREDKRGLHDLIVGTYVNVNQKE